jgi:cytochrome bd ubiquinol oxidase subunit II
MSLALVFLAIMAFAILAYVLLDGFDLGIGILSLRATATERDQMLATIGPFWDANETWLVLGVGVLLVAFPAAHGIILGQLYTPVCVMLLALIVRGASYDFRVKAQAKHQAGWDLAFGIGSLLASLAQGFMLGRFVLGFRHDLMATAFAMLIAASLAAGYAWLGAGWLVLKTRGKMQTRARQWIKPFAFITAAGIAAVSICTPLVSEYVSTRWFAWPNTLWLAPIPLSSAGLIFFAVRDTKKSTTIKPYLLACGVFLLAFFGLAYSLFPYVVMDQLTYLQAAASPATLSVIFIAVAITLPMVIAYSIYTHIVFRGPITTHGH